MIYSKVFGRGVMPVGPGAVIYTVPAGKTSVIRAVQGFLAAAPANGALYVRVNLHPVLYLPYTAVAFAVDWSGRIVLNAGDTVTVIAITNQAYYYVSGYELTAL